MIRFTKTEFGKWIYKLRFSLGNLHAFDEIKTNTIG